MKYSNHSYSLNDLLVFRVNNRDTMGKKGYNINGGVFFERNKTMD